MRLGQPYVGGDSPDGNVGVEEGSDHTDSLISDGSDLQDDIVVILIHLVDDLSKDCVVILRAMPVIARVAQDLLLKLHVSVNPSDRRTRPLA